MLFFMIGCQKIDPAPQDVDGLAHYLWQHFDDDDSENLAAGILNLHQTIDANNLSEIQKGSISALTQPEINLVNKENQDASLLNGVYFANIIPCSVEFAEQSIYATNQDELHPGDYVRYDRSYTSDFEAYTAREEFLLTWETNYEVDGLGYSYEAWLDSAMRYIPSVEDIEDPTIDLGAAFLSRGVLSVLYSEFLMLIFPFQVKAKPVLPDLVGKTQSNISTPLFTAPNMSDGVPTPIR